jgi:DMSO/TMAO reductase YedYZ molybdopterin-dependent catalytic subunit
MSDAPVSRGFRGRRDGVDAVAASRVPPGQHVTADFPVLSAGPTPRTRLEDWNFALQSGGSLLARWSWAEFQALPQTRITVDIHCVTKWSKFDTAWEGVTVDTLLAAAGLDAPPAPFAMAHSDGAYTTNLPLADLLDGKAMVALRHGGQPLSPEHGGPARLLVPHLYFWKSAKWVRRLRFMEQDAPGFWESLGYHIRGDPWGEQRYEGD